MHSIYFIIAGEKSADNHGALLMEEMLKKNHKIIFKGIGGEKMIRAGLNSIVDINQMAIMGFVEIIKHLNFFRNLIKILLDEIDKCTPTQIILIDYPGFNLRLAKRIKEKFDISITYYISPQLWAWKENRINIIKKYVDQMLVIFPFEENWYKKRGVEAKFVGHPIFDEWEPSSKSELCKLLNLNDDKRIITLYPGSRLQEVKKHLPVIIQAAFKLKNKDSSLQFILGASSQIDWSQWILPNWIQVEKEFPQKALECADFAIVASGTATFEAAIYGTPMIVIYKMATASWWLSKLLVKVSFAGMVNIIAQEEIVPELLQKDANSEKLFMHSVKLLNNYEKIKKMKENLINIRKSLYVNGASCKAAEYIFELS